MTQTPPDPSAQQGGGSRTVLILLAVLFVGPCLLGLGGALFVGALREDQTASRTEPTAVTTGPAPRAEVALGDLRVGQCIRDARLSSSEPVHSSDTAVVVRCTSGPVVFEVFALTPPAASDQSALAACEAEAGGRLRETGVYAYRADDADACLTRAAAG